jgi:hypothetical protein
VGQRVSQSSGTRTVLAGEDCSALRAETPHVYRDSGDGFTGSTEGLGLLDRLGVLIGVRKEFAELDFDAQTGCSFFRCTESPVDTLWAVTYQYKISLLCPKPDIAFVHDIFFDTPRAQRILLTLSSRTTQLSNENYQSNCQY